MRVAILGGGPAGYVSAVKLAQLGAEVTLIEQEHIGGTCLNEGCIPTKVLLNTTELYNRINKEATSLGLDIKDVKLNWPMVQERKNMAVFQLVDGVKTLLETNKVNVIQGRGKFLTRYELEVITNTKERVLIPFDKAIIATGSTPIKIPIAGADLDGVITSREALSLDSVPESICIIGGGVIGVEFANIFLNAGSKVTIIEMLPNILTNIDEDLVECLKTEFIEAGVEIHIESRVEKIEAEGNKLKVTVSTPDGFKDIIADKVLMATGRRPNIQGLGLEAIGIKTNKGAIVVDESMKTSVENIYAIGDCNGKVLLAHVASAQGIVAAENIMGKFMPVDFRTIPYCVYTKPEIASVGLTEKDALEKGYRIKTSKFPLYANGKSVIMGEVNGLVKFVVDKDTDEILGLNIAGNNATELIHIGALAIRLEATVDEILTTIYAHPTVSESIHEAAYGVNGHPIHLPASN
ncbi:MAG: dihydrolipoyl dehydrogenase [Tissierellia bacterium]|nr:dihydrolipoyl dehydrogenase [Tissierellia bacterium]